MQDQSEIRFTSGGTVIFTGDAVRLYQAKVVRQGIKACQIGLRLNSSYTPTNLLRVVGGFTGKRYKRGRAGLAAALQDMEEWIAACEAAMPVTSDVAT